MKQRILQLYQKIRPYVNTERIVFVCLILLILFIATCNVQKKERIINQLQQSARIWKDKYGNSHASVTSLTLSEREMKRQVDSIRQILGVKPKQVIQYVHTTAKIDTNLHARVDTFWKKDTVRLAGGGTRIDSTLSYHLSYRDSTFLSVEGIIPQSPQRLQVQAHVALSFTQYWKRQKSFLGLRIGRKEEFTDVGTDNPYIQFENAVSYKSRPPLRLRVAPGVGTFIGINPLTGKPVWGMGAGLIITLIR